MSILCKVSYSSGWVRDDNDRVSSSCNKYLSINYTGCNFMNRQWIYKLFSQHYHQLIPGQWDESMTCSWSLQSISCLCRLDLQIRKVFPAIWSRLVPTMMNVQLYQQDNKTLSSFLLTFNLPQVTQVEWIAVLGLVNCKFEWMTVRKRLQVEYFFSNWSSMLRECLVLRFITFIYYFESVERWKMTGKS